MERRNATLCRPVEQTHAGMDDSRLGPCGVQMQKDKQNQHDCAARIARAAAAIHLPSAATPSEQNLGQVTPPLSQSCNVVTIYLAVCHKHLHNPGETLESGSPIGLLRLWTTDLCDAMQVACWLSDMSVCVLLTCAYLSLCYEMHASTECVCEQKKD